MSLGELETRLSSNPDSIPLKKKINQGEKCLLEKSKRQSRGNNSERNEYSCKMVLSSNVSGNKPYAHYQGQSMT